MSDNYLMQWHPRRDQRRNAPNAPIRTARKEYPCEVGCGHTIERGEQYRHTPMMRMCIACFDERYLP